MFLALGALCAWPWARESRGAPGVRCEGREEHCRLGVESGSHSLTARHSCFHVPRYNPLFILGTKSLTSL